MTLRRLGRFALAAFFMTAGIAHFAASEFFVAIMPPYLPLHLELVYLSGVCEVCGAVGILWTRTRKAAGVGLITLTVAVFPANLHMALHPDQFSHSRTGPCTHACRCKRSSGGSGGQPGRQKIANSVAQVGKVAGGLALSGGRNSPDSELLRFRLALEEIYTLYCICFEHYSARSMVRSATRQTETEDAGAYLELIGARVRQYRGLRSMSRRVRCGLRCLRTLSGAA